MVRSLQEFSVCSDTSIEDLRKALLESGLVEALQQLIANEDVFLLYQGISILQALDIYGAAACLPLVRVLII